MPKISPIKTSRFVKFLKQAGCVERGNYNGDHCFYTRPGIKRPITIITTEKELPGFHVRQYLKALGISEDNYLRIISKIK